MKSDKEYTVANRQLELIGRGNLIQVYSIDGQLIRGYFQGTEKFSFDNNHSFLLIKRTSDDERFKIPDELIEKVEVIAQEKKSKFVGLFVGGLIDLVIIISLVVVFR